MKKIICLLTLICLVYVYIAVNIIIRDESKINYYNASLRNLSAGSIEADEIEDISRVTIQVNCKSTLDIIKNDLDKFASNDEVEEYKNNIRQKYSKYFNSINNKIANYLNIDGCLDIYVSKYSPIIEYTFDINKYIDINKEVLDKLSSYNLVDCINVFSNDKNVESLIAGSTTRVGMKDIYDNQTYTGDGVKIGLLEGGIVNEDHENLTGADITVRREWFYNETETEHALCMASVIVGTEGIARNASLYSVELFNTPTSEVDWLLEKNVDIINCSFGFVGGEGSYDDFSAYFDYISKTYNVMIVSAVGNDGCSSGKVTNPALGYNVLSVGGMSLYDFYYDTSTQVTSGPCKPTISVPSDPFCIDGFFYTQEGTSFGCAMMSSIVALLMEKYPAAKVKPELVISAICSGAMTLNSNGTTDVNGLNDYTGAGKFNFNNTCTAFEFYGFDLSCIANMPTNTQIFSEPVELLEEEIVTICTFSKAFANGDKDDTYFPTVKIQLVNSDNVVVASSYSSSDNLTFLRYTIPYEDEYSIRIIYMGRGGSGSGNITSSFNVGYSLYIYTPSNYE